jgi:hypothetical protein
MFNKKRKTSVRFPFGFKAVDIGEDTESKRTILNQQDNKLVLLCDGHQMEGMYFLARVRVDPKDNQCYYAQIFEEKDKLKEIRMHYHDLEGLMGGVGYNFLDNYKVKPFSLTD